MLRANAPAYRVQTSLIRCKRNCCIKLEHICSIPKGFGMEQAFTELTVKIMFDNSSGIDEMRWTIILQEKHK